MENKKSVDESWKETAAKEKALHKDNQTEESPEQTASENAQAEPGDIPELNFTNYITSLVFQTMIFLGEIANPLTNEVEINLRQAKFLVDTLSLLKEKTKGNLSTQEDEFLTHSLYELQVKFVERSQQTAQQANSQ